MSTPHRQQPDPSPSKETTCDSCKEASCSARTRQSGESDQDFQDRRKLQERLCRIRCKILVMSGKGGVGKSTVAVNLAVALRLAGKQVGLLDVDIHGPSIPTMLGLENRSPEGDKGQLFPIDVDGLKVMSLGFFLRHPDEAVIWRGPLKMGAIKQFLKDVAWGDLDFLIIDSPPGTGDEPLSIAQIIPDARAVIVTTPQEISLADVRKSINFCKTVKVEIVGVIENMSGIVCPRCDETVDIFKSAGGESLARELDRQAHRQGPGKGHLLQGEGGNRRFPGEFSAQDRQQVAALGQFLLKRRQAGAGPGQLSPLGQDIGP